MPGRTPNEAYEEFIRPIVVATSCLGQAKIVPSPGARSKTDREHAWSLNAPMRGMVLPGGRCLKASMRFRYVEHERGWKVSTLGYMYTFSVADVELWSMHWHPDGSSPELRPHLHAAIGQNGKGHLPTPRMAYEDAIEWAIRTGGCEPARPDWEDVLSGSKAIYVQFRSWGGDDPSGG